MKMTTAFRCCLLSMVRRLAAPALTGLSLMSTQATAAADTANGLTNPLIAFNVQGATDYGTAMQFLDIAKMMRPWIGHEAGQWGGVTYEELVAGGYIDADGWVTGIPEGVSSVGTLWQWSGSSSELVEAHKGVYVLTYEGEGTLKVTGDAKILSQEDGKIVFENRKGENIYLWIAATDPENTGDYIRNISIVAEKNLDLYEAGAVYNPEWLDLIDDARQIRFMPWTNSATPIDSDSSRLKTIADMVQLANEIGADPWFVIPTDASDDYIREMAEYVRDNLDPDLTVRVEYGNELWNYAFMATVNLSKESAAAWGVSSFEVYQNYVAKKATEVALIWEDVFAGESDGRLANVLGTHAANPWVTETLLKASLWKQYEPDSYVDPATVFEEVAITSYFGGSEVSDADLRADLLAAIKNPSVDAQAWLADKLMDPTYKWSIPYTLAVWEKQKAIAEKYGVGLTSYEGGQHTHHSFSVKGVSNEDLKLITDFMVEFVRSEEMAELYQAAWKAWASVSDSPFMQFGDVGAPTKWGSWSLYESLTDTNPRSELLEMLNATSQQWWDEAGGTQYQQGVTATGTDGDDLLIGTLQEDYLLGGKGNDVFVPGKGKDGINGGAGTDRVILSGSVDDYAVTVEGKGYRVVGPDGSKFLINVEQISFDDEKIHDVASLVGRVPVDKEPDTGNGNDNGTGTVTPPEEQTPPVKPDTGTGTGTDQGAIQTPGTGTGGNDTAGGGKPETPAAPDTSVAMGRLADGQGTATVTIASSSPKGVVIEGVQDISALGKELGLRGTATPAYTVQERGTTADTTGATTALDAALSRGAVITDAAGIVATAGNDTFLGRGLADVVHGGAGEDFLSGNDGNDRLYGDEGNDKLYGGAGDDWLTGGAGNDSLYGGEGTDHALFSGNAADYVIAAEGNGYRIDGTDGSDYLEGIEMLGFGDASLSVEDFLAQVLARPAVELAEGSVSTKGEIILASQHDGVAIAHEAVKSQGVVIDAIQDISALGKALGLYGAGDTAAYAVYAKGAGADFDGAAVSAGYYSVQTNRAAADGPALSADAVETALKLASIIKGSGAIIATDGNDTFNGRGADDIVYGGASKDVLNGAGGNDHLDGGAGDDRIHGGAGNDTLIGGAGNDTLGGGEGSDLFVFAAGCGRDMITDFSREDDIDFGDFFGDEPVDLADYASLDISGHLVLSNGADHITFQGLGESDLSWLNAGLLA